MDWIGLDWIGFEEDRYTRTHAAGDRQEGDGDTRSSFLRCIRTNGYGYIDLGPMDNHS